MTPTTTQPARDPIRIVLEPDAVDGASPQEPAGQRSKPLGRKVAVFVLILALIGSGAGWLATRGGGFRPATVTVTHPGGAPTISVSGGSTTLPELRARLQATGSGGLLALDSDGSYVLNAALDIAGGGKLEISAATLKLASTGGKVAQVLVTDGQLSLDRAVVVSWNGTGVVTDPASGRGSLVARGPAAVMDVRHSLIADLGTDSADPGTLWAAGARGSSVGSDFRSDFAGIGLAASGVVRVDTSSAEDSTTDGVLVVGAAAGTTISDSHFDSNTLAGVSVTGTQGLLLVGVEASGNASSGLVVTTSRQLTVRAGEFIGNKQQGLTITSTTGYLLQDVHAWGNVLGIGLASSSGLTTGSWVSGNITSGIVVTGGTATLATDRIDHNSLSGLEVDAGTVLLTDSLFDENETGMQIPIAAPHVTASGNRFTDSVKDGIALTGLTGLNLTSNTISGSGLAAVSLASAANIKSLLAANVEKKGQPIQRVRGS